MQKGSEARSDKFSYKYASHDSVTAALHPHFAKHGVVCLPSVEECTQEGNRTRIKLALIFVSADDKSDSATVYHYGYGIDSGDKGVGKAISYAYKYGLLKTFCLETGDDPDENADAVHEPAKCLEFDERSIGIASPALTAFVEHCATSAGKHIEDIKRQALKRWDEFMKAYEKWAEAKRA